MDRIALISDIHGNIPALEAVFSDIKNRGINRVICLGDLAGKGPSSELAVDKIKDNCELVLKGNWDYLISEIYDSYFLKWHRSKLKDAQIKYLIELPIYIEFYFSGKLVRVFHSSHNDVFKRVSQYSSVEDKMLLFKSLDENIQECDMIILGHLHEAYVDNFKRKTILNVGSVGNPLDMPQASYGIIEGEYGYKESCSMTITLVRVEYDIEKAIQQAIDSRMPDLQEYIDELRTARYRGKNT